MMASKPGKIGLKIRGLVLDCYITYGGGNRRRRTNGGRGGKTATS
jgi:hypothetical protein